MSKEKNGHGEPRDADRGDRPGDAGVFSFTNPVSLPFGVASAVLREGMLHAVKWERSREDLRSVLSRAFPGAEEISPGRCAAGLLLLQYSEGRPVWPVDVAAVRVEWSLVRGFSRRVLKELVNVPYGKTIPYGGLAARIGNRKAARAVGAVLSRNPWPVIVPCHRVVGACGRMVGFGKGIPAKGILLAFEKRNLEIPKVTS